MTEKVDFYKSILNYKSKQYNIINSESVFINNIEHKLLVSDKGDLFYTLNGFIQRDDDKKPVSLNNTTWFFVSFKNLILISFLFIFLFKYLFY